jgi:squalene-hopene/tetraprenyl-beta-curcumene cyclase
MMHFMDEVNEELQSKIANFLSSQQSFDGSYLLLKGGLSDLSGTVKAYYALKLAGDSVDSPHMIKAREWILAQGGAAKANVLTRILLAMFGQISWRGVPFIPVEMMLHGTAIRSLHLSSESQKSKEFRYCRTLHSPTR